jgi:organic radical activating enzyme
MRDYFGAVNAPLGIGAVLKGWDITESDFRNSEKLPVIDFRGMTADCPHNCRHCFTDKSIQTLSLKEVKGIQSELAELGAHGIAYLGEGEPTLDKNFFPIIEHAASLGIQPIVFTDGATKLRDPEFAERLYATGASVCLKCDSLYDPEYQNWLVNDPTEKFFDQRKNLSRCSVQSASIVSEKTEQLVSDWRWSCQQKTQKDVEQTLRLAAATTSELFFPFLPNRSQRPRRF